MEIKRKVVGIAATNCYLLREAQQVLIIDPGADANLDISRILMMIRPDDHVLGILLTHGHFDHIIGVDSLVDKFHCPVYIHPEEAHYLTDPRLNGSRYFAGKDLVCTTQTQQMLPGVYDIGPFHFEVTLTAGHTPNSITYLFGHDVFDGDFIFRMSIGRMDLPGGSELVMRKNLRDFINTYHEDVTIYSGHGEKTNLDLERKFNPYLQKDYLG